MIVIQDIWTAIDLAYEEIAQAQLDIAKRSRLTGDVTVYNAKQLKSTELYSYIIALEEIDFNHNISNNKIIEKLYNNIKLITKDLRRWD